MKAKAETHREIEKLLDNCRLNWFTGDTENRGMNLHSEEKKDYYSYVNTLLKNLTNFSLYLKTKPIEQRKAMLKILLRKINNQFKDRRKLNKSVYYQGVYMPLSNSHDANPSNFVV